MDEKKSYLMFTEQDHFAYSECSFQFEKENMPKYTIMYLNQSRISYEGSKKIYYAEYFLLGQILKRSDSPKNLEDVVLEEQDVVLILPQIRPLQMLGQNNCLGGSKKRYF